MHFFLQQYFSQLRTQLFQTELQLQAANPGTAEWKAAMHSMQQVLKACADCTAFAETHLYPLADRYEPALIDALKLQQRHIFSQHLAASLQTFEANSNGLAAQENAATIRDAFDAVVLAHMQYLVQLQKNLLPVLQRFYTPEVLQQLAKPETQWQGGAESLQESQTAFRGQLFRAENELAKAATSVATNGQALAMHY